MRARRRAPPGGRSRRGSPCTRRRPAAGGAPARFGFDGRGFLGAVTSPLGRTWRIASDADGRVTRLRTPAGASVWFDRSSPNEPSAPAAANLSGAERVRLRRGSAGSEQELFTVTCDGWGRLIEAAYPDGTRLAATYLHTGDRAVRDPAGSKPAAIVDRLGRTTRFAYDEGERLVRVVDGRGRATVATYDAPAQRLPAAVTYAGGRTERYAYDALGNLSAIAYPDGVRLRVACEPGGADVRRRGPNRGSGRRAAGRPALLVRC